LGLPFERVYPVSGLKYVGILLMFMFRAGVMCLTYGLINIHIYYYTYIYLFILYIHIYYYILLDPDLSLTPSLLFLLPSSPPHSPSSSIKGIFINILFSQITDPACFIGVDGWGVMCLIILYYTLLLSSKLFPYSSLPPFLNYLLFSSCKSIPLIPSSQSFYTCRYLDMFNYIMRFIGSSLCLGFLFAVRELF
jgi:hypothetical protein